MPRRDSPWQVARYLVQDGHSTLDPSSTDPRFWLPREWAGRGLVFAHRDRPRGADVREPDYLAIWLRDAWRITYREYERRGEPQAIDQGLVLLEELEEAFVDAGILTQRELDRAAEYLQRREERRRGDRPKPAAGSFEYDHRKASRPPRRKPRAKARPRRNFSAPKRRPGESPVAYHDRLAAMAADALDRGEVTLSSKFQVAAAKIAIEHPEVTRRPRKRGRGPGTYTWNQCVAEARARGARDPDAVCGAIRARSRRRYPIYWRALEGPGRDSAGRKIHRNGSREVIAAYKDMVAALEHLDDTWNASSHFDMLGPAVEAAIKAGSAACKAYASGDPRAISDAVDTQEIVRERIRSA